MELTLVGDLGFFLAFSIKLLETPKACVKKRLHTSEPDAYIEPWFFPGREKGTWVRTQADLDFADDCLEKSCCSNARRLESTSPLTKRSTHFKLLQHWNDCWTISFTEVSRFDRRGVLGFTPDDMMMINYRIYLFTANYNKGPPQSV